MLGLIQFFRQKSTFATLFAAISMLLLFIACENGKDPFSASNSAPGITEFSFAGDSLKFTGAAPNDAVNLNLKYSDTEGQELTATFRFLTGNGRIIHGSFTEISSTANSVTFDVPTNFDSDEAGRVKLIPDTTGLMEIELVLADKVKSSTRSTSTFVFRNQAPVASFTIRGLNGVAPYEVEVDPANSRDRDAGSIKFFHWIFGDGSDTVRVQFNPDAASNRVRHNYQLAGTYSVQLLVEDDEGAIGTTDAPFTTDNQAPLAALQVTPLTGEAPHQIQFTATNSVDPDGDIVSYRIDFDNGESTFDSVGTHTFQSDDTYQVKLTVRDNLGLTATTEVNVEVATPPIADLVITPNSGSFPLQATIDASGSRDPQNGNIDVDIFIENNLEYETTNPPAHTFSQPGNFQVRLVVTNQRNGLSSQVTRSVTAINLDPVADFTWFPDSVIQNTLVEYTSQSFDPNDTDEISFYRWTFPEGVQEGENLSRVQQLITTPLNDPYEVKLEVWDSFRDGEFEGYHTITYTIPEK